MKLKIGVKLEIFYRKQKELGILMGVGVYKDFKVLINKSFLIEINKKDIIKMIDKNESI